ncbi:lytic polysaccharide monooxygenase [Peniophora sp. CONT]|nr:lytic polysaccharide monooxygenase [Peniophora sp. CONT]
MSARAFIFISTLVVAQRAAAHGYLGSVAIDGTTYTGPTPSANPDAAKSTSVIRQVADISPVQGASNDDLRCGLSAAAASQEADAKPGSTVEYWWSGGGGQNWPHNTGPVITYMAECTGTPDCTTFDASKASWFKIDQISGPSSGTWYQAVFMKKQSLKLTLPTNLPSGHYLFRNEIIALHNAVSKGGAEFYPSCVQLNVQGGSGSTTPSPTVQFPGAYSDSDPGIFVPEIYNDDLQYVFPGGPVSNLASSSDSSGSPPADENASTSSGDGKPWFIDRLTFSFASSGLIVYPFSPSDQPFLRLLHLPLHP